MWFVLAKPQRLIFQKNNGTIWSLFRFTAYECEHVPGLLAWNRGRELWKFTIDEILRCQSLTVALWLRMLFKNQKRLVLKSGRAKLCNWITKDCPKNLELKLNEGLPPCKKLQGPSDITADEHLQPKRRNVSVISNVSLWNPVKVNDLY